MIGWLAERRLRVSAPSGEGHIPEYEPRIIRPIVELEEDI